MSHDEAIASPELVETVDIRWRHQKNNINNEEKTVARNAKVRMLCGVTAAIHIVERAKILDLHSEHPVCVFTTNGADDGRVKFITETHITNALRHLAKEEYGFTKEEDLSRYTSHSVRVGACIALHAAGLDKMEIQHALRWRSTAFWNYLRNLPQQAARCMRAIRDNDPMSLSPSF
jgi:hypothetical protein